MLVAFCAFGQSNESSHLDFCQACNIYVVEARQSDPSFQYRRQQHLSLV